MYTATPHRAASQQPRAIIQGRPGRRPPAAPTATCGHAAAARWHRRIGPPGRQCGSGKAGMLAEGSNLKDSTSVTSHPESLEQRPNSCARNPACRPRRGGPRCAARPHLAPLPVHSEGGGVGDASRLILHVVNLGEKMQKKEEKEREEAIRKQAAGHAEGAGGMGCMQRRACSSGWGVRHCSPPVTSAQRAQRGPPAHLRHRVLELRELLGQGEEVGEHLVAVAAPRGPKVDERLRRGEGRGRSVAPGGNC